MLYGEWSEQWGREGANVLLRATPDVQAIFCGSDQIARGVATALLMRAPGPPPVICRAREAHAEILPDRETLSFVKPPTEVTGQG